MGIIHSRNIALELEKSFANSIGMTLITAYLTSGIFAVFKERDLSSKDISLFFRGNKKDFFNGSVCIKTVRVLYELGVRCYLVRNLHSKIYIFDNEVMYIGSANLTNNGLSISASSNIEVLYKTEYEDSYKVQLEESLRYAVVLTNDLLCEIETVMVDVQDKENKELNLDSVDWSFWSKSEYVNDLSDFVLPRCNLSEPLEIQNAEDLAHDQFLFGLEDDLSFDRSLFVTSALHHFLVKEVMSKPQGKQFIRFGELKKILSKELVIDNINAEKATKNIFSYYKDKKCLPLNYDRFNYTESLKLQL